MHASPTTGGFPEDQCSFNRKNNPIEKILIFELRGWCQSYGSRSKSRFPLCNSLWFHKGNFIIMGSTPNFETTSWARKLIFFLYRSFFSFTGALTLWESTGGWAGMHTTNEKSSEYLFFSVFLPAQVTRLVKLLYILQWKWWASEFCLKMTSSPNFEMLLVHHFLEAVGHTGHYQEPDG